VLVKDYPFIKTRPDDIARPYLPVTILNQKKNKEINVYALIDTGADECALPASLASLLGHNLKSGYKKKINTGNGLTTAYSHSIRIKAFNFVTDEVLIDFMPNLHIPLLGVKSFLSNFILKVNYKNSTFSLL
jgi:predicted aspartyl protease